MKNKLNQKTFFCKILPSILLGILIVSFFIFLDFHYGIFFGKNMPSHVTVVLTEDGFQPDEFTIGVGDVVTFKTELGEAFWPASNSHPEHTIYPEFDPRKPVAPKDSWTFTFLKPGVWRFHDHINANTTGTITVLDEDNAVQKYGLTLDINECAQYSDYITKRQCWEGQLEIAMEEGGVIGAFAYFDDLYKTEPDIPKECHGWTHALGKAGYAYYIEHGTIELTESTTHCGYGFYHAYLAEIMKYTGDIQEARAFCENITLSNEFASQAIRSSCKHGLGHGTAAMLVENPENYGAFFSTSEKAVKICEQIYQSPNDLIECYDGVYNELYQDIINDRYGYSYQEYVAKNDPYWHCQQLANVYKESCYINVVGILPSQYGDDVVGMMQYVLENTEDLELRGKRIVAKVAADRIQTTVVSNSHQDSLDACDLVPGFLYDTCFRGILNGFIQHGESGNVHKKGYAFCDEDGISEVQRGICYETFTQLLESAYTPEEMKESCKYALQSRENISNCKPYL